MRDPYQVLGVGKDAAEGEVKKAYRKLAKMYHPDRKSDHPNAKERFNEANSAYEILGDPKKRAQFDKGEIDAEGKPRFQGFEGFGAGRPGAGGRGGNARNFKFDARSGPFGGSGGADPSDIFSHLFGNQARTHTAGRRAQANKTPPPKGDDIKAEIELSLSEATLGTTKRVRTGSGREIEVTIPEGVTDAKVMRLRGLGRPDPMGGSPGDIMLTIRIKPDDRFTIEGANIRVRVPVALETAVLGGALRVPTLTGEVEMQLPPMTSGNRILRLRGKGIGNSNERGDLLVAIDIMLPEADDDLTALMKMRRSD